MEIRRLVSNLSLMISILIRSLNFLGEEATSVSVPLAGWEMIKLADFFSEIEGFF